MRACYTSGGFLIASGSTVEDDIADDKSRAEISYVNLPITGRQVLRVVELVAQPGGGTSIIVRDRIAPLFGNNQAAVARVVTQVNRWLAGSTDC